MKTKVHQLECGVCGTILTTPSRRVLNMHMVVSWYPDQNGNAICPSCVEIMTKKLHANDTSFDQYKYTEEDKKDVLDYIRRNYNI